MTSSFQIFVQADMLPSMKYIAIGKAIVNAWLSQYFCLDSESRWDLEVFQLNAHVFGGDPENVLLMGHGSGAASASLLALSPRAEGKFKMQKLIISESKN